MKIWGELEEFYENAQIASAMDSEFTVGGNGYYSVDRILEGMAEENLIPALPERLTYDEMCAKLIADGREDEIEYLME